MVGTWGAIGEAFDMRPEPEAFLADGERVAVLGRYVGRARGTGKPVEAAFAHFWRLRGGLAVEIRQVTDSQAWNEALRADG